MRRLTKEEAAIQYLIGRGYSIKRFNDHKTLYLIQSFGAHGTPSYTTRLTLHGNSMSKIRNPDDVPEQDRIAKLDLTKLKWISLREVYKKGKANDPR